MVGSHTILSTYSNKVDSHDLEFLKHEDWFKVDLLLNNPKSKFILSHYKGYPFDIWENDEYFILLEGMIYNFSDENIEKSCKTISDSFCSSSDYLKKIIEFVESADGDFIIQIYDKRNDRVILFNDYFGRLAIYISLSKELALISREIKFILNFMPEIRFDKRGLVENLMYGYTLGEKTFFQDIKRLNPCEFIICRIKGNEIDYNRGNTAEFNFKSKNRFWNKKRSLVQLKDQFLTATENRVNKLQDKGYKIISDLSGGYDSRAVMGAISKFSKNVDYITYEYIQDESNEAAELFKVLDNPGTYKKTSFKNKIDFNKISELAYKTDGLANYYTTGICYHDAEYIKKTTPCKTSHFGGFGGEFIRHPEKKWLSSIVRGIENSLYSSLSLNEVCSMTKIDLSFYKKELKTYFGSCKETKKTDILKHFYYEYYRNNVGLAGEERGRIFQWSIQPMWSKDFVKTIIHQIPLKWTGYKYFIEFMRLVDPNLLEAPIYKSDIALKSKHSIKKHEKLYRKQFNIKNRLLNSLKFNFPYLVHIYKYITAKNHNFHAEASEDILKLFYSYYKKLEKCNNLFDLESVEKYIHKAGGKYNRMITLGMYLYEIEKRYINRISIEK